MTKEMVISANRHETKVAVLEDDQLVEVYFQRANEYSLAGSIHKGRVTRVLPGMQSAFVDLGLERDTFLYVSDFFEENEEFDQIPPERERRPSREERPPREDRPEERARREEPREVPVLEPGVSAAEPVEEAPATQLPAVEPVAGAAPDPAAADRGNRQDRAEFDRDRHRRSRRRRNRGRGFPESKYASPSHVPAVERPAAEPVETEKTEPEPENAQSQSEFPVLPGESLAKYRHTTVAALDSGEQEELGAASPVAELTAEQVIPEEVAESELESESEADTDQVLDEIAEVDAIEEEEGEPVATRPVEPEPERNDGVVVVESAPSALEEAEDISGNDPVLSEEAEVNELVAEALAEAAETVEAVPDGDHGANVELEAAEGQPAAEAGTESEAVESHTDAEAGDTVHAENVPAAAAPSEPVEASVREQSGRYIQHRISRRMRRRMRSQGRPDETEPRRETEAAAPAVPPEPPKPEIRPEIRQAPRAESRPERSETRTLPRLEKGATASITDLLKEGQEILVQIAKEPLGQKGARITSHIALPGRYVVYMPTLEHMGVSRKIASDEERARLKRILQAHHTGIQGGFIVRTAGEGKSEEDIAADVDFLANLWIDIRQKADKRPAPALVHHDLDIVQRLLRDQLTENFKAIWVDNEDVYESILRFVQRFQPALVSRVKLYTRPAPIFDAFSITSELEKALRPKVWLKSGGYIVINQTEALVAVDVNTGKFVGKSNRLEDTIVKTNTEAVKEIVRQIRLRDLGGIIVVDFIDMDERKNRQKVMQALEEAMRADKAPYKILQFNDFGLVAITRKRVKQSLERALCTPCPYCEGAGYVKSVQTIVGEILQEAVKIAAAVEGENNVILRVNPDVAKTLKSTQNHYLEELESILRRPVLVKGDPQLHHEKFDLA